jgi:hypothetical protein
MARRVAAKLEPEVGPKLGMYVEKLIALGDAAGDEAPAQRMDTASAAALASVLMSALTIALAVVHKRDDERRRKEEDQRRREDEERRREEQDRVLRLAESAIALASELRAEIQARVRFPDAVQTRVRVALVEAVVEEAKRLEGTR